VTPGRRTGLGVVSVLVILVLTACGSPSSTTTTRTQPSGPRTVYVAVGGSDSVGYGTDDPLLDAWPQQFFRRSLPLQTVFINAAVPRSTVAEAITDQAPLARSSRATVVTVWLVSADLLDGTPVTTYASQLLQLLTSLRGAGATTVLVGNVPPLDELPGYPACRAGTVGGGRGLRCPVTLPAPASLSADVAAYNQAIAVDATRSGSVLVDLGTAVTSSVAHGGQPFLEPSGADLSTAGSTLVAEAFGDRLRAVTRHTA